MLDAPGVLGTVPNIVANRMNSQHDLAGPSFTVSSEERADSMPSNSAAGSSLGPRVGPRPVTDASCFTVRQPSSQFVVATAYRCGLAPHDGSLSVFEVSSALGALLPAIPTEAAQAGLSESRTVL